MTHASRWPFLDLGSPDLTALARAAVPGLNDPAHLANVVENLVILQGHARILNLALPDGAPAAAPVEAFAP
jgi:hypothetical protein